jgi:hypothetical protein
MYNIFEQEKKMDTEISVKRSFSSWDKILISLAKSANKNEFISVYCQVYPIDDKNYAENIYWNLRSHYQ